MPNDPKPAAATTTVEEVSVLWHTEPDAMSYTKFRSRSHDAALRVYDDTGNVIETH